MDLDFEIGNYSDWRAVPAIEHIPVLQQEVLAYLRPQPDRIYLDATVGGGGHAWQILKASSPTGILVGIDLDTEALKIAREHLSPFEGRFTLIQGNYEDLQAILARMEIAQIHGVLLDLGASTFQLKEPERGFSFREEGPLDMRMDREKRLTAAELVNTLSEEELKELIGRYGEERWAGRVARSICQARERKPLASTRELAEIVATAIPRACHPRRIHPATKTFQALRIAVNGELESLVHSIEDAVDLLAPGGRICVISFHSLEDRLVKHTFRKLEKGCICPPFFPACRCGKESSLKVLTRHPVTPSAEEVGKNPSSRSSKLRAAERI
ncbi:MAG: 16S rRNA (cytosine(1402)-N(4))-methyltransferase RsmH [Candidatus Tectomicrobia bacterium]|uniref:Ribosomal RNA small subunit methyltransferase H n=1 Tax=Tectimicrobiota bacterium TaxID=2528274 RepID=A0A932CNM5_UNCTE|nr:16S rRNA (cytosine(1402)-N(4))-methyltransferase RsmH [Candidatus Tectomicrobia bacterium]